MHHVFAILLQMERPRPEDNTRYLSAEMQSVEQQAEAALRQELTLARRALTRHRNTPMWGYAYADSCASGGNNDPTLAEIRHIDEGLCQIIEDLEQQLAMLTNNS
jgi:hypothetical protein